MPASIAGYSFVIVLTNAFMIMALSSLTRSSRFAGVNLRGVIFFFSQIFYGILKRDTAHQKVAWLSLGNNLEQVGDLLFGQHPEVSLAALGVGAGDRRR